MSLTPAEELGHISTPAEECSQVTRTGPVSIGWGGSPKVIYEAARRLFRKWASDKSSFSISILGIGVSNFEDLQKEGKGVGRRPVP